MISLAAIVNRALAQFLTVPVTDDDILTECEWCDNRVSLGSCIMEKFQGNLLYRCTVCTQNVLIISAEPAEITDVLSKNGNSLSNSICPASNDDNRAGRGFPINGWRVRSVDDLFIAGVIIPKMPPGSLRHG